MKLTEHYSVADVEYCEYAVRSGFDNKLPEEYYENALELAENVLEPVFDAGLFPVVTSWYRGEDLEREFLRREFLNWCYTERKHVDDISWKEFVTGKRHTTAQAVTLVYTDEVFNFIKDNLKYTHLTNKFNRWISVVYLAEDLACGVTIKE